MRTDHKKRSLRSCLSACICILIFFLISIPASAETDDGQTVRVGYYENEVFQEGAREGTVKTGYAYEYYRKLSEYTGWNYEYVYGSFDALYEKLLSGEVDLLAGLAKRDDRLSIIAYPDLPMGNEIYTLVKHEEDTEVSSDPKTVTGKRIGVLKSAIADVLEEYLNDRGIDAVVVRFGDYGSLFDSFDSGEVDILAAEGDGAYGREHAEVICTFGKSDYYLCVRIGRDDLLNELNAAQEELTFEEPNYLASLRSRYYSSSINSHTFSSDEKEWISGHDHLITGYLENYLPYSATDRNGDVTGIVRDILPEMMEELNIEGIDISYIGYEKYDDMILAVRSGEIDVAFPVGGGLFYSEENGIYESSAVASTTTDLVYGGEYTEETTGHFAVNENNRMQDYYIRTHFPEAQITMYPSIDDCLEAVLAGKASATTLNGLRANDILRNSKYGGLHMTQLTKNDDRSFGVKIGNEGLLRLLNRGINVLGSEYAQSISYRYAANLYKYTFADVIRDHLWQFIALTFIAVAAFFWFLMRDLLRQKRASRMKTDFVSSMSHEIRTPITAILGMNELIRRECDDTRIQRYADNIEKAGESLLGIINDILDFSKIEAGRMELVEQEYSLPELISGICVMIRFRAQEKGLAFGVQVDGALPRRLDGDEQKLRQIMTNLLTNAVKYTEKGKVELCVSRLSEEQDRVSLRVSVKDTGIGIRREEMGKLFSAFDRLDLEHTGTIEGSGLGLTITQRMLELMGSRITVESTYGAGSTFSFILSQRVCGAETIGDFAEWEEENALKDSGSRNATFTAPDARLLIVDDTPMNLQVISGLLKRNRMQIDTADSGAKCIELFGTRVYDMVFLDQRMPIMDGVETMQELKNRYPEALSKTPVISLTANVLSGAREEMLRAGFADYLTKPVNLAALEQVLLKYLPEDKVISVSPEDKNGDAASAGADGLPEGIGGIRGLDIARGLEYCGDAEDYVDALRTFAESAETKAEQMEEILDRSDAEALSLMAHSLKSTSGAIGAEELKERARALEMAAREDKGEIPAEEAREFLREYRSLAEAIGELITDRKGRAGS